MPLVSVACMCGSSDSVVRNFLHSVGYPEWNSIPVVRGKEKSLAVLNQLPPFPERDMLSSFLENVSKWAVIIGYNDEAMRWSDISHGGARTKIEAELVVRTFAS